jgi:trk system potassium uptake protein TrkH
MKYEKKSQRIFFTHARKIALGFFLIIIVGTLLLMLPISSRSGEWTSLVNALFTATSATCVTGLVVFDTYQYWSIFGQLIIIVLIQIGGLGFITFGVGFSMFLKRKIGLARRNLIQESVSALKLAGVVKLVKKIIIGTAIFEGIGAVLLAIRFVPKMGLLVGIYNAVFHSISAFCNAGFDLMGRYEQYSSLTVYSSDIVINITIMLLIIIGGLGFIVWDDIWHNRLNFKKYSLHSKIVLISTTVLVFGSAILFGIFENNNLMQNMNPLEKVLASLFASVTARTAGFNTIDLGAMTQSSKLLTDVLMFIGGSPGSTAGGVKTTSIVVMIFYIGANLRGIQGVNILGRRISEEDVKKASVVIGINLGMAVIALIAITASQNVNMDDLLLEVFSAIATVGLSTGVTRQLTVSSKLVIIFLMYCGRIGSTTFATSFIGNKRRAPIQYPEERINVG